MGFATAAITPPHTQATGEAAKSIAKPAAATPEEIICRSRYRVGSRFRGAGEANGRWKTEPKTHTAKDALSSSKPT